MSKIIGIDLGTTNSCVAVMEGKDSKVIPNPEIVQHQVLLRSKMENVLLVMLQNVRQSQTKTQLVQLNV